MPPAGRQPCSVQMGLTWKKYNIISEATCSTEPFWGCCPSCNLTCNQASENSADGSMYSISFSISDSVSLQPSDQGTLKAIFPKVIDQECGHCLVMSLSKTKCLAGLRRKIFPLNEVVTQIAC